MAMRKSFIEIGYKVNKSGLTEAKTAVDKLIRSQEKMLNNLDAYDQRNRKIAASQQSVNSELQKTATYQSQTAKEQAKVTDSVVKTRAEQRKLSEAEGKTRQKAVDTGDSIVRSNEKSARAVNRTRRSTEQASTSFDKLHGAGSRLVNMGSAISMAMLPVAAAFKKSADEATELENKYTTIRNLLHTGGESAGASAAETKQMEKDNNRFALQYGVAPTEMSKGGEELIRRGYSGSQELASHKYFLQAARASGDDYNSVVGYGAPALEQFGYKTKAGDSQKKMAAYTKTVLNQMAYGADLSATDFTGIGNSLRYAGATAHSANQSLSGTIGAIGVLSNNGQDGTVAGTGLRKDINSLMNPSSGPRGQGEAALKSIGLTPDDLRDSHDNLLSLDKAFELLNSHMKGMNDTERASVFHGLFGTTGQESALILSKNVEQMKSLTGQVQNAEKQGHGKGYIADLAQKNMKSWKNQIEVFKQYMNVMGLGFTKTVLPGFTHMLTATNHVLKALIKLPQPVKDLTGNVVALGSAMAVAYAGSKLLRKGLDWMGGSGSRKVGRQTQLVQDVAQDTAEVSGYSVPRGGTGTRSGSTHFKPSALSRMSGLTKLTIAGVGLDVGTQAVSAFKQGIDSKSGGQKLWDSAGSATGAAIGGVLTGGNPVGIMIGEQMGKSFAKTVKASDFVKPDKHPDNKHNAHKKVDPNHTPSLHDGGEHSWQGDASIAGTMVGGGSGSNRSKHKKSSQPAKKKENPFDSLSKDARIATRHATALISAANENWVNAAADFSLKQTKKIKSDETSLLASNSKKYGKAYSALSGYVAKTSSKSTKAASYLEKIGVTSATSAQKALNSQQSYNQKHLANVKSDYTAIELDERNGGKNRLALVQKLNTDLLKLTDRGGQKQRKLLTSLNSETTRLGTAQYAGVISESSKALTATKRNARKTYDSQVASAQKQYDHTLKAAKQLYGVHSAEYKRIKGYAQKQYDSTTDKAKAQYKKVSYWAEQQRDAVTQAAADAAGGVNGIMGVMSDNITIMGKQLANAVGGTYHKPKTDDQSFHDNTDPTGNLAKGAKKLKNKETKSVVQSGPVASMPTTGSVFNGRAAGGPITRNGMAMVGEAGTEIGYDARKGTYQIYDHGPQLVHLTAGMHIMNHRDSLKAMRGGLGRGRILPGYAKGTGGASGSASVATTVKVKGVNDAAMKNTEYKTKRSADKIGSDIVSGYGKGTKGAQKKLTGLNKKSNQILKDTKNGTNKQTDLIRKQMIADFDAAQKGADKQLNQLKNVGLKIMDKMQDGMSKADQTIVSDFGNNFGKLPGLAKSSMKGAITNLNNGFTGIDSALSQFGGNKSVLKPIHYAAGSNGPIASDQMAVLNDATAGPRQELVGRGDQLLKPIGDNGVFHLKKGDNVFNGAQVERAKPYLPHFAKGTGASDDKLRAIASANSGNPGRAFNKEFSNNVKLDGSALQKGTTNTANAGAKKVGVPWSSAMWGLIQDTIEGGTAAGGKWIHTPGLALTNGFGAARSFGSHDGNDFSGPLGSAILAMHGGKVVQIGRPGHGWPYSQLGDIIELDSDDGYHQIYQEFGGMSNIKVAVGDVVKTGQRIATLGHLNGAGSGAHVHVGLSHGSVWDHGGSSTKGWLDITKMRGGSDGSSKLKSSKKKINGALTKLVKSQLGSTAIKWIEKNLQDTVGGGQVGGSVSKGMIEKAAKAMHVNLSGSELSTIQAVIQHESGGSSTAVNNWDVNAKNGTPSKGILQFIDPTFKHYAVKGHGQILNAYDQLLAMFNDSNWRRDVHTGGWGPTGSRRFATGGRPNVGESVIVGEKGPELVNFDRPATIRSADATRQLANKAGAKSKPSIQNTFHIDLKIEVKNGDAKEIAKNVKSALRDELDNLFSTELENLDY